MITGSAFEAWLAARITGPVARDLRRSALDPDPRHAPGRTTARRRRAIRASRSSGVIVARRSGSAGARASARRCRRRSARGSALGVVVGRRASAASAARIAATTASTVSSNVLPSVTMIARVGRGSERRDRPVAVELVATPERGEDRRASGLVGVEPALLRPAARPLLDRRVEEDLQVRVGQHDRADVAARHDDPAGRRRAPAGGRAGPPELGDRPRPPRRPRRRRGPRTSSVVSRRRRARGPGGPCSSGASSISSTSATQRRVGVVGVDAAVLEGEPGHGAVEQARVAEPVAERERRRGADAALARRARGRRARRRARGRSAGSIDGGYRVVARLLGAVRYAQPLPRPRSRATAGASAARGRAARRPAATGRPPARSAPRARAP